MTVNSEMLYTKSHEWIKLMDDTTARVGLTDFAQASLGDLVFVNLPEVGDPVAVEESFADVESVKAVSDVYSPVTGTISAVNEELLDAPEKINAEPYEAWLVEISDITDREDLLTPKEYEELCETEGE
ncbi:glycine cleavage system protein GcvH [Youxingia wuxianensis]|uniref:Glycine cleavage system H protein n=1 Tax=Youxingia wuxianensis TaxID=2763678 RepID=A0A926IIJ6_9FIRM|nr:glycine cleavage system protein GcvH [Youxingia wuxianensis]MBC8586426.1 glycine cleavage system protein GcvH [Youxingia wuxianensis]